MVRDGLQLLASRPGGLVGSSVVREAFQELLAAGAGNPRCVFLSSASLHDSSKSLLC